MERALIPAAVVWGANWLSAYLLGFPFVYCWLAPFASDIYLAFGQLALYLLAVYIVVALIQGKTLNLLAGLLGGFMYFQLPVIVAYAFAVGGSCG